MNLRNRFEEIKSYADFFAGPRTTQDRAFLIELLEASKQIGQEYGGLSEDDYWELCQRRLTEAGSSVLK